ncbi:hypothetical protein MP638_002345 [Amoeboaphelidium occidentale]|nr:hypothetical protein MP638_002345 [Amoeboaphelidium occidentale]
MLQDIGSSIASLVVYGDYLLSTANNDIVQRSIETGQTIRTMRGHTGKVYFFRSLNSTLYSVGSDERIVVWDLETGAVLQRFTLQQCQSSIGLFVTFDYIFASCDTRIVKQYDRRTGEQIRSFGRGIVTDWQMYGVAYGDYVYSITSEDRIAQWNIKSGNIIRYFIGHSAGLCCVELDENGYVYSCGDDANVFKWDVETGAIVMRYEGFAGKGLALKAAFGFVYASSLQRILYKWNADTGDLVFQNNAGNAIVVSLEVIEQLIFVGTPVGSILLLSQEGEFLKGMPYVFSRIRPIAVTDRFIIGGGDAAMMPVYDLANSALVALLDAGAGEVNDLFIFKNHNESFLFAATASSKIFQWSLSDLRMTKNIDHEGTLLSICANDDAFWVGDTPGHDFLVKQWSILDSTFLLSYQGTDAVYAIEIVRDILFFSDSRCINGYIIGDVSLFRRIDVSSPAYSLAAFQELFLMSGHNDGLIRLYRIDSGEEGLIFKGHSGAIFDLQVVGSILYSGSFDGTMKKFSIENARLMFSFENRARSVDYGGALNGKVFTLLRDGTINSYHVQNSSFAGSLKGPTSIRNMFVSRDTIYAGDSNGNVKIFDQNLQLLQELISTNASSVSSTLVSSGLLFVGYQSGEIKIYDNNEQEKLVRVIFDNAAVTSIAFNGEFLFASSGLSFSKWSIASGERLKSFIGHKEEIMTIVSSGDSVFSASIDKTIKRWDINTNEVMNEFKRSGSVNGHLGAVMSICIIGNYLFSASADTSARLWDISTQKVLEVYIGHTKPVYWVAYDNQTLFTGSEDQATYSWNVGIATSPEISTRRTSASSSIKTSKALRRFVVGNLSEQPTNIILIIIIVSAVVVFIIGVMFCSIARKYYSGSSIATPMEHKDSGTSQTTTGATSFMGTLFTKTTGISKPAYLEANSNEFRMIKQIAQGGGGAVFIGEFLSGSKSTLYGKTVIFKKFADSYDKLSKPSKDAFDQEISLMDFFRNEKYIAKIYGYSHAPCCIIMKFYHNQSLDVWIQRNPGSSMRKRSQFALDIAQGISTMHSKSIAHNDLKPQNVLLDLDSNGRLFCVITDFGISHILSEKVISAKAFSAVWLRGVSARYASPEAYERYRKHLSAPAKVYKAGDIYCFAGILYDFLTTMSPWSKATM